MTCTLQFNLRAVVETLVNTFKVEDLSVFLHKQSLNALEKSQLLDKFCSLLIDPKTTLHVVRLCRPIVLALVARTVIQAGSQPFHLESHENTSTALSQVISFSNSVRGFVLEYFRSKPPVFERLLVRPDFEGDLKKAPKKTVKALHNIVSTAYRLLEHHATEFVNLWDWGPLLKLAVSFPPLVSTQSSSLSLEVCWYLSEITSILLSSSNAQRDQLRQQTLSRALSALSAGSSSSSSASSTSISTTTSSLDFQMLKKLQDKEAQEKAFLLFETSSASKLDVTPGMQAMNWLFTPADLDSSLVEVCGVLLPKSSRSDAKPSFRSLISTPTTIQNMRALALAVSQSSPILLEGVTGSGKTELIDAIAEATGHKDIIKIHLGDESDGKVLLGTYVCTEIPGEFQWQPGCLTRAVAEGRWIVIEDLDLASHNVLSILLPLLETRKLFLPSRSEEINAAHGFQIFATQTLLSTSGSSQIGTVRGAATSKLLSKFWTKIVIEPLPPHELQQVIVDRFPGIPSPFAPFFIETFLALQQGELQNLFNSTGRFLSTRDLIKWCKRVERSCRNDSFFSDNVVDSSQIPVQLKEKIFLEAVDCFCGLIPNPSIRLKLMEVIARPWQLTHDRIQYYFDLYKPSLHLTALSLTIGRIHIGRNSSDDSLSLKRLSAVKQSTQRFAETMHSLRLLERISSCIVEDEPILLVGETGTGKTSVIQYLANQLNQKLVVQNLNQQSDSTDLLGGFKPIDLRLLCTPLKLTFERLFSSTYSKKANKQFLLLINQAFSNKEWKRLLTLFNKALLQVEKKLGNLSSRSDEEHHSESTSSEDSARLNPVLRKEWQQFSAAVSKFSLQHDQIKNNFAFSFVEGALVKAVRAGDWILLDEINLASTETLESLSGLLEGGGLYLTERGDIEAVERHPNFRIIACMNPPTDVGKKELPPGLRNRFTEFYVEELNNVHDLQLVVQCYLANTASNIPVANIVSFYLQAKKCATEILSDGANQKPHFSLRTLCRALQYCCDTVAQFGFFRALFEGFSMSFLTQLNEKSYPIMQTLISTQLIQDKKIMKELKRYSSSAAVALTNHEIQVEGKNVTFGGYTIEAGNMTPEQPDNYILTPTIIKHLKNLSRIAISRKHPVLLQGPTSSGKTSMVAYLAQITGHRFVRINNHEHTDLQEYIGSYVSDQTGKLVFQEGVLVEAVRKGYWIVLDELNLAPSEVLEALNRLLDDNRELFIPETQETVVPHPHFMLFATQNPPGLYGGRKVLSRAFRNRFLELHFDDIPDDELQTILEKRCKLAPSYSKRLVNVMKDLQRQRQGTQMFAGKQGFITLRDLFRWANRGADDYQTLAEDGYMLLAERLRNPKEKDIIKQALEKHLPRTKINVQKLYSCDEDAGYLQVQKILQEEGASLIGHKIVWTPSMKRLWRLIGRCLQFKEPILLVGETGCGKTTVCQLYSLLLKQQLHILNCHQHTETSDFLGGLRPVRNRDAIALQLHPLLLEILSLIPDAAFADVDGNVPENALPSVADRERATLRQLVDLFEGVLPTVLAFIDKPSEDPEVLDQTYDDLRSKIATAVPLVQQNRSLFEWQDGPLVQAMRNGDLILIDEISLAEDSVLERLNSVLEPDRLLVLAERAGRNGSTASSSSSDEPSKGGEVQVEEITALEAFRLMATMNPGGDFGKKELSPALRNRFTEIWVPTFSDREELTSIIETSFTNEDHKHLSHLMLDFLEWFNKQLLNKRVVSLRDILTWVHFINIMAPKPPTEALDATSSLYHHYVHGACMVLLDGISLSTNLPEQKVLQLRKATFSFFQKQLQKTNASILPLPLNQSLNDFVVRPFANEAGIIEGSHGFGMDPFFVDRGNQPPVENLNYSLSAPTTSRNIMRLLRAMQMRKPILLEGSPGVGKTSLVQALAAASGHKIVRINLSEQTDMMDLLGSDLPVEGGKAGEFQWNDGVFLRALKEGDWVLLDELNLASQSVLEGLNACLDHRATVYIPELGREFPCPPSFRVFGCQNPTQQGGGRKGLPKSFLNRFSQVFVEKFDDDDLYKISASIYPEFAQPENDLLRSMIDFNSRLYQETMVIRSFGHKGSPWEFNLRDVFRWCDLLRQTSNNETSTAIQAARFIDLLYLQRMRTPEDRESIKRIYHQVFGESLSLHLIQPSFHITADHLQVGFSRLPRNCSNASALTRLSGDSQELQLLHCLIHPLENLMKCVEMNWMSIIVGPPACGKTCLVKLLADLTGNQLHQFWMNSSVDTTELLGGFEQVDLTRKKKEIIDNVQNLTVQVIEHIILSASSFSLENQDLPFEQSLSDHLTNIQSQLGYLVSRSVHFIESNAAFGENDVSLLDRILESLLRAIKMLLPRSARIQVLGTLRDEIETLQHTIEQLQTVDIESIKGCFEWMDGMLIKALEQGDWILIDNVNFCNPTVLDRLNPLLETGGSLMVNERGLVGGQVRIVTPHPNFRIFLTMDPSNGEISRAMRNRGIELVLLPQHFLLPPPSAVSAPAAVIDITDNARTLSENVLTRPLSLDCISILNELGVAGMSLPQLLIEVHISATTEIQLIYGQSVTIRELVRWGSFFLYLMRIGVSPSDAVKEAFDFVYIRNQRSHVARERINKAVDPLMKNAQWFLESLSRPDSDLETDFGLLGPGLWPLHINSRMMQQDACFATVARNLSLLQFMDLNFKLHNNAQTVSATDLQQFATKYVVNPSQITSSSLLVIPSTALAGVYQHPKNKKRTLARDDLKQRIHFGSQGFRQFVDSLKTLDHMKLVEALMEHVCLSQISQYDEWCGLIDLDGFSSVLKQLLQSEAVKHYRAFIETLYEEFGFHSLKIPLSLEANPVIHKILENAVKTRYGQDSDQMLLLSTFKRCLVLQSQLMAQKTMENDFCKATSSSSAFSSLSIIQLSFLMNQTSTTFPQFSELENNLVRLLIQVFEATQRHLYAVIQTVSRLSVPVEQDLKPLTQESAWESLKETIRIRSVLWSFLSSAKGQLQSAEFTKGWHIFSKHLQSETCFAMRFGPSNSEKDQIVGLVNAINELCYQLNLSTAQNRFYRVVPHAIPFRHEPVRALRNDLLEAVHELHSLIKLDGSPKYTDLKRLIVQALCTLPSIDKQREDSTVNDLLQSFSTLPVRLRKQTADTKEEVLRVFSEDPKHLIDQADEEPNRVFTFESIPVLSDAQQTLNSSKVSASLAPYLDFVSLCREGAILLKSAAVLDLQHSDSASVDSLRYSASSLVKDARSFIFDLINEGSRSPIDALPHQQLAWILDQDPTGKNTDTALALPEVNTQLLVSFFSRLWDSSFEDLTIAYHGKPPRMTKREAAASFVDIHDQKQNRLRDLPFVRGSARLFEAVLSAITFHQIKNIPFVNLMDRTTKIDQMRRIVQFYQTSQVVDPVTTDWQLVIDAFFDLIDLCFVVVQKHDALAELHSFKAIVKAAIFSHKCSANDEALVRAINFLQTTLGDLCKRLHVYWPVRTIQSILEKAFHTLRAKLLSKEGSERHVNWIHDDQIERGKLWVFVGLLRLIFLIPINSIDPVAQQYVKIKVQQLRLVSLSQEANARSATLLTLYGPEVEKADKRLKSLSVQIEEVKQMIHKMEQSGVVRPVDPTFKSLYADVRRYVETIGSHERVLQLLSGLVDFEAHVSVTSFLAQEQVWQDNTFNLVNQLKGNYIDFCDIVEPLVLGLLQIKCGLRLVAALRSQYNAGFDGCVPYHQQKTTEDVVQALMSLPRTGPLNAIDRPLVWDQDKWNLDSISLLLDERSLKALSALTMENHKVSIHSKIIQALLAATFLHVQNAGRLSPLSLSVFKHIFSVCVRNWAQMKAEKEQKEKEENDLYRRKVRVHTSLNEEEIEEEQLKQLFPDYSSEFTDLDNKSAGFDPNLHDNLAEKSADDSTEPKLLLGDREIFFINKVFQFLYSDQFVDHQHSSKDHSGASAPVASSLNVASIADPVSQSNVQDAFMIGFQAAAEIFHAAQCTFSSHFDLSTLGQQMSAMFTSCDRLVNVTDQNVSLTGLQKQMDPSQNSTSSIYNGSVYYNIYVDPNPSEAQLLLVPMEQLQKGIVDLLKQWPENPMLINILEIIQRIMHFELATPLMKFVTGLEMLLRKMEEWEKYAHKAISLEPIVVELAKLVARWRKIELRSWPFILESRAHAFRLQAMQQWFDLYTIVDQRFGLFENESGPLDPYDSDKIESAWLGQLIQKLVTFLTVSNVGQFQTRLQLQWSFYLQLHLESGASVSFASSSSSPEIERRVKKLTKKIRNIFYNVHQYFSQFVSIINEQMEASATSLKKQFKDFIKLAKWEKLEYYRLKDVSDRSHKKLNKFARNYEKILVQPVAPMLQKLDETTFSEPPLLLKQQQKALATFGNNPNSKLTKRWKRQQKKLQELLSKKSVLDDPEGAMNLTALLDSFDFRNLFGSSSESSSSSSSSSSSALCSTLKISLLPKIPNLWKRMKKLTIGASVKEASVVHPTIVRLRQKHIEAIEELSTTIIETCIEYRSETEAAGALKSGEDEEGSKRKSLLGNLKQRKVRSLHLLLTTLRDAGISKKASACPSQYKDLQFILQHTGSVVNCNWLMGTQEALTSGSKTFIPPSNSIVDTWNKADSYYYRSLLRIQKLRELQKSPVSRDLSSREVNDCLGYSEHLGVLITRQRYGLLQWLQNSKAFDQLIECISRWTGSSECSAPLPPQITFHRLLQELSSLSLHSIEAMQQLILTLSCSSGSSTASVLNTANKNLSEIQTVRTQLNALHHRLHVHGFVSSFKTDHESLKDSQSIGQQFLLLVTMEDWKTIGSLRDNLFLALQQTTSLLDTLHPTEQGTPSPYTVHSSPHKVLTTLSSAVSLLPKTYSFLETVDSERATLPIKGPLIVSEEAEQITKHFEELVSSLLITVQNLRTDTISYKEHSTKASKDSEEKNDGEEEEEDIDDLYEDHILKVSQYYDQTMSHLAIETIVKKLHAAFRLMQKLPEHEASAVHQHARTFFSASLHDLYPLLYQISIVNRALVVEAIKTHKASSKLQYVILGLFNTFLTEGYCSPPDQSQDDSNEAGSSFETSDGTGMGEGQGKNDVSDQIEDQEDLARPDLAPKDKKDKEKPDDLKEEEKGVEMDNDFEGDMFDKDQPEDQEEKSDSDSDDEEDEDDDMDKQMGDIDRDQEDMVDEKLWSDSEDDDEPEDNKPEGEGEAPLSNENADDEELMANENNKEDSKDKNNDKDKKKDDKGDQSDEDEFSEQSDASDEGEREGEMVDIEDEKHMHDDLPPEEEFELPDDMNIEDDQDDEEDTGDPEGEDGEGGEEADASDQDGSDGEGSSVDGDVDDDEGEDADDDETQEQEGADQVEDQNDDENKDEDQESTNEPKEIEVPDEDEDPDEPEDDLGDEDETGAPPPENDYDDETLKEQQGIQDNFGNQSQNSVESQNLPDQAKQEEDDEKKQQDQRDSQQQQAGSDDKWIPRSSSDQAPPDPQSEKQQMEKFDPNPYRSLGDATKEWKKKLQLIQEDDSKVEQLQQPDDPNAPSPETYQFQQQDDAAQPDDQTEQALGPATEEQQQEQGIQQQSLQDDEEDEEEPAAPKMEDPDEPSSPDEPSAPPQITSGHAPTNAKPPSADSDDDESAGAMKDQEDDLTDDENDKDDADADPDADNKNLVSDRSGSKPTAFDDDDDEDDEDLLAAASSLWPATPLSADEVALLREEMEKTRDRLMSASRSSGEDNEMSDGDSLAIAKEQAQHLWQQYEALTASQSQELCEQLRLILEPSLASKLQGDYRTGKRINMKKVITYIASQFRKDKIWLRRTKPHKRNYQVLIAIDDSESMTHNKAGQLACEALTLISRSLSRLEVGELAILKFGDDVELLHPFDQPFTDENGPFVVSQFTFQQKQTNVHKLLTTMVSLLEDARNHSAQRQVEKVQLVFVISDGRLSNQSGLAQWIREAEKKRMLLAFIIIDDPRSADSILKVETIGFKKSGISRSLYIDDFPFPYYLILRDLNTLPDVLADAMRQWFELIQRSSDN